MGNKPNEDPEDDKIIILFPQAEEIGPTLMMSKEQGLAQAIAEAAKRLELEDAPISSYPTNPRA